MNSERIEDIAQAMVSPGQGILAADESTGTILKRFDSINVENTEDNRRAYREMIFRTEEAMNNFVSGVILFEETLYQKAGDGTPMIDLIRKANAVPGIKADTGAKPLAGSPGQTVTGGLDDLRERMTKHHEAGARFAKWRAVISISDSLPTRAGITANAHALARYSAICQEVGLVPIVEPEVQMDGDPGDHSIDRCAEVSAAVLKATFDQLEEQNVVLEGIVLKPNMVLPGVKSARVSAEEVADKTLRVLKAHVPVAVPGIAFLSGGMSDEEATANLSAMNAMFNAPWKLTFSYGRALQAPALKAWGGQAQNAPAAQQAFTHRARMNGLAALGQWAQSHEQAA